MPVTLIVCTSIASISCGGSEEEQVSRLVTQPGFHHEKGALSSVSQKMTAIRGLSCEFKGRF